LRRIRRQFRQKARNAKENENNWFVNTLEYDYYSNDYYNAQDEEVKILIERKKNRTPAQIKADDEKEKDRIWYTVLWENW